jgi:hypothetical protein
LFFSKVVLEHIPKSVKRFSGKMCFNSNKQSISKNSNNYKCSVQCLSFAKCFDHTGCIIVRCNLRMRT